MTYTVLPNHIAPRNEGWYWCAVNDDVHYGPEPTREDAWQAFWDDVGQDMYEEYKADQNAAGDPAVCPTAWKHLRMNQYTVHARHPEIACTRVIDVDYVLENLTDRNEEAVWDEAWPEWSETDRKELDSAMANTLYRWLMDNKRYSKFRALEYVPCPKS